jgi:FMN reductase
MRVVAVNGSPSDTSKTHTLAALALERAGGGTLVDVSALDAHALVLRGEHASVREAVAAIEASEVLILATPVYRATYSGLLKLVLDQLRSEALRDVAVVLIATGGGPTHYLSLDTGLRAVVASLGGWGVPTVVYATGADFDLDGQPLEPVRILVQQAVDEAARIAGTRTSD